MLVQPQFFGSPSPGHGWTSEALADVALRYPSLDLTSVRPSGDGERRRRWQRAVCKGSRLGEAPTGLLRASPGGT